MVCGALSSIWHRCVLPLASIVVASTVAHIYGFKSITAVVYLCCHVYDAAYEHASKQKRRCCIECLEQETECERFLYSYVTNFRLVHSFEALKLYFVLRYGCILKNSFAFRKF
jgi:hypothetical protein